VTDASHDSIQLRVLVSSGDSSKNWDLRCFVRERLITYINREFPLCLPKLRTELGRRDVNPAPLSDERQEPVVRQPEV